MHEVGHIKALERVQRKAARYVLGRHRRTESVSEMLKILGWESLESRRKRNRPCGMYKIYKGDKAWRELRYKVEKPNFIGRNDHKSKIKCRAQRTNVKKISYLNKSIVDWNGLPED